MPSVSVPRNAIATGPGYLYIAALGTSLPTNTVSGSVFTDSWPGGWSVLGVTKQGSEFDFDETTEIIDANEFYDPLQVALKDRSVKKTFELMQISATNFKAAMNGGTISVTGSGATTLNHYTPAPVGGEVRQMVGWEAQDGTERLVLEQAFQTGSLKVVRQKGATNATLPLEFTAELAASGFPFQYWTAGTVRS